MLDGNSSVLVLDMDDDMDDELELIDDDVLELVEDMELDSLDVLEVEETDELELDSLNVLEVDETDELKLDSLDVLEVELDDCDEPELSEESDWLDLLDEDFELELLDELDVNLTVLDELELLDELTLEELELAMTTTGMSLFFMSSPSYNPYLSPSSFFLNTTYGGSVIEGLETVKAPTSDSPTASSCSSSQR